MSKQADADARHLFAQPPFRRFLLQIWRDAGISLPAHGADQTLQYREGRRSLGLDILRNAGRHLSCVESAKLDQVIRTVLSSEAQPQEETEPDERISGID